MEMRDRLTTAFITDGLLRKSLSATRSLGRRGIVTVVGESTSLSPSGFSKYCKRRVKYPDPKKYPAQFLQWLYAFFSEQKHPVFLPMDEPIMEIAMQHREEILKRSKCMLPSKDAYEIASDKYKTIKLAEQQGVVCPKTYRTDTSEQIEEVLDSGLFPMILKPKKSNGSRGIRKVVTPYELLQLYKEIHDEYGEVLIQEYIPLGDRFDVCLLYNRQHEVVASFVQKEIRHFPIEMGPSTVQESVTYEYLIQESIRLLAPLNWCGIVEVEFMIDSRTNRPVLMEINPRFWNSLELAVKSGVDFPLLLYQLCLEQDVKHLGGYEIGCICKNTIPGDILHFIANPTRKSMQPSLLAGRKAGVYDDTFSLKDPMPVCMLLIVCIVFMFDKKTTKRFLMR